MIKNTLVVGVMGLVIGGMIGWFVNGWRLEAAFGRAQNAALVEYERLSDERRKEWESQSKRDEADRLALAKQLRQSRALADDLRNQVSSAELVAAPSIETLSECPTHEEVQAVLANHNFFTADFVRLWNASTRGSSPGPHRAFETDSGN